MPKGSPVVAALMRVIKVFERGLEITQCVKKKAERGPIRDVPWRLSLVGLEQ